MCHRSNNDKRKHFPWITRPKRHLSRLESASNVRLEYFGSAWQRNVVGGFDPIHYSNNEWREHCSWVVCIGHFNSSLKFVLTFQTTTPKISQSIFLVMISFMIMFFFADSTAISFPSPNSGLTVAGHVPPVVARTGKVSPMSIRWKIIEILEGQVNSHFKLG